ncbi:hypothetical protein BC941DRAFT_466551 [Chlamydoabsidia padenii]|nr:hypothetical protein BC941DRAFT_466551 [Chlamydoabsidia padenii]
MTNITNLPSPTISSKDSPTTAVQVAIRVRPLTQQDRFQPRFSHSSNSDVIKTHGNTLTIVPHQKSFSFDYVFDTESTQEQLFSSVASNLVDRFLDGYNATILAYGQTSSGKTHTIMGTADPDQEGIIPRAMSAFFERLNTTTSSSSIKRPTSIALSTNLNSTSLPASSGLRIPRRSVSSAKLRPLSTINNSNNASPLRRDSASSIHDDLSNERTARHTVHVSFVEIYNEELIDLLNPAPPNERPVATIREDTKGQIHWTGVKEVVVNNTEDVLRYLQIGTDNRATGSTDMNAKSSRSHAIFTVTLKQEKWVASKSSPTKSNSSSVRNRETAPSPVGSRSSVVGMNRRASSLNVKAMVGQMEQRQATSEDGEDGEWMIMHSKFHFVDLAGSERLKRTAAEGDRRKEGININAGLLALGNVISALASDPHNINGSKKAAHIPYRDSKLTRLLQDSLGGNATTLMIACISSSELNLTETVNTIKYAHRARNIKNKVERNEAEDWMTNDNPDFLRSLITKLKSDIRTMRSLSSQSGSVISLCGNSKSNGSNRRGSSITSPTTSHSSSSEDDQPLPPSPSPSVILNNAPSDLVDFDHDQLLIVSDLRRQIEELHNELTVTRERNQWVESQLGEKEQRRQSQRQSLAAISLDNINGNSTNGQRQQHIDSRVSHGSHDSALGSLDLQHSVDPVIEEYENSISSLGSQLAVARAAMTHSDQAMAQQETKMMEFQTLRDQEHKELAALHDALLKAQEQALSSKNYIEELETKLAQSNLDKYNSTSSETVDGQVGDTSSATSNTSSDSDANATNIPSVSFSPLANELQQQLEKKEAYVATLESRLAEMDALHTTLANLREEHSHTIVTLEQQLADMKENHTRVQNDLQAECDQAKITITELTSQMGNEKIGHQDALNKYAEIQQLVLDQERGTQITLRQRLAEMEQLKLDINALQLVETKQEQIIGLFEQKLEDMEQLIGQLHQQLDVKDAHLKQLEQDNQQKTQWVQAVKKDLQAVLRDMATLGMERKNLDLIVAWMDKSLQRQDDRTMVSLVSLGELQQLHKLRDADYKAKLQMVENLEARVLELSTSVEQGDASTHQLTLELTDAKAALADEQQRQQEKDNSMNADIDAQRLAALEGRIVELDQAIDQAKKDRTDLNHALASKQSELELAQLTIEKQTIKITHIEQQLKEAMSSMEKERELMAANDTTGMLAELEDKLQVLQRARQLDQDEYDERFDRAIDDLEKSKLAYKDQSLVVTSLEQSLKVMQKRLDEAMANQHQHSDSTINHNNHWSKYEEGDVEEEAILSSSPPLSTSTSSSLLSKNIQQGQQQQKQTYDVATLLRQLTEQEALLHEKDQALMKLQQRVSSLPSRTLSPLPSTTPSRSTSINALASADREEQEKRIAQLNQDDIKSAATPEEMLAQLQQFANDKTLLMMQVDDLETQLTRQRAQFNIETKHLESELMKLGAANDRMEKEMEQLVSRHVLPPPISASRSSGPVFASGNSNTNNVTSPPQTPRVLSPPPHGAKLHRDLSANSLAKLQNASSYRALSAMDYHHPSFLYQDEFGTAGTQQQRPASHTIRSPVDRPGSVSSTTSSFIARPTSIPPPSAPPSNPLPPIPTTPLPAIPTQQPSLTTSSSTSSIAITSPNPLNILQRTNSTQTNNSLISDMSPPNSQQSTQTTAEQYDKMLRSLQRKAQIAESDVRAHQDVISKLEHQLSRSETSVRDVKKQLEVLNKEKLAYSMEIKNLRSQVTQIMTQQKSSGEEAGERRKQLEHSLEQERRLKEKAEKARLILENRMEELMTKKNKFMCF